MNTFGRLFRFTSFGESHGPVTGGVIDGCPAGLFLDQEEIRRQLSRRSSRGGISTPRAEKDLPRFLSGLTSESLTTGAPIAFVVPNEDVRGKDYAEMSDLYRPSHSDYTYQMKYGVRSVEGGGRSSARETVARVVAGAVALQLLRNLGVEVLSYTSSVGSAPSLGYRDDVTLEEIEVSKTGCPDRALDDTYYDLLLQARADGDTLGGTVTTIVRGVPVGWGEPLYDKLHARLAFALMSINAARAFEIGDGREIAGCRGSEANDPFVSSEGAIRTASNHSGGVQGGISNGETLRMRTSFKPISSIRKVQQTVDREGNPRELLITGRHDASVFPRVLPVCDAMVALTLADFALLSKMNH